MYLPLYFPTSLTPDQCDDQFDTCPEMAKNDYCTKYPDLMKIQCKKSCHFCGRSPLCINIVRLVIVHGRRGDLMVRLLLSGRAVRPVTHAVFLGKALYSINAFHNTKEVPTMC